MIKRFLQRLLGVYKFTNKYPSIAMSERAIKQLRFIVQDQDLDHSLYVIRIGVRDGICGPEVDGGYLFDFTGRAGVDDICLNCGGMDIVVHPSHAAGVDGMMIDYPPNAPSIDSFLVSPDKPKAKM